MVLTGYIVVLNWERLISWTTIGVSTLPVPSRNIIIAIIRWQWKIMKLHKVTRLQNYIDVAPARRMEGIYNTVDPTLPETMDTYYAMTTQERIGSACTLDLSVGKIFYLRNRQSINFNLSVNNVLNKRDIRTGGYEQARVFASDGALVNPALFPNKYYYMQGINCFANISYRF